MKRQLFEEIYKLFYKRLRLIIFLIFFLIITSILALILDRNEIFLFAAENGYENIARFYIKSGINLQKNSKNYSVGLGFSTTSDLNTALMLAAQQGNTKIVELLLANGAEVNVRSKTGHTALMHASY